MANGTNKVLMALAICGALNTSALAQSADQKDAPAGSASASDPSSNANNQAADATTLNLGQGTKAQAEHSAQATAHKSVNDPNNQLGTSLQGRTRPVAGTNDGPPYDAAAAGKPAEPAAQ